MKKHFQDLMDALFRHVGIEMPDERRNEVYSVGVDGKIALQFFAAPEQCLNVIADIGALPQAVDPGALANILKLNCFTPVCADFNFKVGFNEDKKRLELWIWHKLDELDPAKLVRLFEFAVEAASYVKDWVDNPLQRRKSAHFTARATGKK